MSRLLFANQLFASLIVVLAGCATTGDKPTRLQLTIAVAKDANPDETGRPSPVVLDVFDLTRGERFRDADYLALLSAPQKELRSNLLDQQRLSAVPPGSQRVLNLEVDSKANYIGVVAELVKFSDAQVRVAIPLKPGSATALKLTVDARGITQNTEASTRVSTHSRFNND